MKFKKSIMTCLLTLGALSVSAQEPQATTVYDFQPHWYVQVQPLGGQYTLGEADFGDLFSYNAQLGLGYQFSPVVGARLALNAWQSKGASEFYDGYKAKWSWKYVAPTVDLTFNLSNLFCGFNPNRVFNFSVFAGLGANIGFSNDDAKDAKVAIGNRYKLDENVALDDCWDGTKVRLVGQIGAAADFKLTDAISLGLELGANTLSDAYNSKHAGNNDWYFNGLVGLKFNLGETYSTRTVTPPAVPERIIERVVEKVVEPAAPAAAAVMEEQVEALRRDVFFKINSTVIQASEQQKVQDIVDYLNQYPNAKVAITGYADKGTGNARINSRLAAGRAKAVVDALVKKGVSASRITSDSKGDTVQPFAEQVKNRVSICIAE